MLLSYMPYKLLFFYRSLFFFMLFFSFIYFMVVCNSVYVIMIQKKDFRSKLLKTVSYLQNENFFNQLCFSSSYKFQSKLLFKLLHTVSTLINDKNIFRGCWKKALSVYNTLKSLRRCKYQAVYSSEQKLPNKTINFYRYIFIAYTLIPMILISVIRLN